MGKIVAQYVSNFILLGNIFPDSRKILNSEDTYLIVFGPGQDGIRSYFKKNFKGKILYEAPKAVCALHPESGNNPRNTLFVVECIDGVPPLAPKESVNELKL